MNAKTSHLSAFTLIELLVVIGVIAILASLLLPAMGQAKTKAQALACMNNNKQLITSCHMYANDNRDLLPPNGNGLNINDTQRQAFWFNVDMSSLGDAWNSAKLGDPNVNKLAQYTRQSLGTYKCPGDKSTVMVSGEEYSRILTYSMNAAVGTIHGGPSQAARESSPVWGPWLDGSGQHMANQPWRTYGKISDVKAPGPSVVWAFMDEDRYSITIPCFNVCMDNSIKCSMLKLNPGTYMLNWPGTYHGFSASCSFLDGHAVIHKWTDPRTRNTGHHRGITGVNTGQSTNWFTLQANPDNPDILWIQSHTSVPAF